MKNISGLLTLYGQLTLTCIFGAVGGVVSVKKLRVAGVGSTFDDASIARTWKVW